MTSERDKRRNEIKKEKEKRERHATDDCECPDYNILYTTTMRTERSKETITNERNDKEMEGEIIN